MNTFTGILIFIEVYAWWILGAWALAALGVGLYLLWLDDRGLNERERYCDYCRGPLDLVYYEGDHGEHYCSLDCEQRGNK